MEKEEKKSVAEIIISQFLKDVEESDTIPWTKPYNRYSAFNWYSKTQYRGINRLILPFGEYLTYNQMVEYNKKNGTNYRYDKENGKWWYVTFFKKDTQDVGWVWANKNLPDEVLDGLSGDGKKYVDKSQNVTLEITGAKGDNAKILSNVRGTSAVTLGAHEHATVTGLPEGGTAVNGSKVEFTVTPDDGYDILLRFHDRKLAFVPAGAEASRLPSRLPLPLPSPSRSPWAWARPP